MFCVKCFQCLPKRNPLWMVKGSGRNASGWKRRLQKSEERENTIHEHIGKQHQRADRVYMWGYAGTGALGQRSFITPENRRQKARTKQLAPHWLRFLDDIRMRTHALACGYGFSVFLCKPKGKSSPHVVFGTGINTDSQLGYQEYPKKSGRILDYVTQPVNIELPLSHPETTNLLQVACGRAHTVIVTDKEGIFTLGNNSYGQCGRSIVEKEIYRGSQTINRVELDEQLKQVVCGQDHTLFLTEDGRVYACGLGSDGQTGLGHYKCTGTPSLVRGDIEGEKIVHLACKGDTVLAVSDKGDLFGWGNSEYHQLSLVAGDQTQVSVPQRLPFSDVGAVQKAAAAGSMCALLNSQGSVFVWGYGLLGKGPNLEESKFPQQIPQNLFGLSDFNEDITVADIQCGLFHFAAFTNEGHLYTWGKNMRGCLGLGNLKDQHFPLKVQVPAEVREVRCGVDHMAALCKSFI